MNHILPTDLINRILVFLASKPFNEVVGLINEIKEQAKPHPEDSTPLNKDIISSPEEEAK